MKWIVASIASFFTAITLLKYLTLSQHNNYCQERTSVFKKTLLFVVLVVALTFIPLTYAAPVVYFAGGTFFTIRYICSRTKLKWTRRVVSYVCLSISLPIVLLFCIPILVSPFQLFLASEGAIVCLGFAFVKLSEIVFNGYYSKKNKDFIQNVAKKFRESDTKLIAVTGSFGKTCCKNILCSILAQKYDVKMTDGNHNTPMGVALSMQKLSGREDFFIAEFGARKKGDITELCGFFEPDIGIITGVCNQHSEVFGSLHTIYNEKFQLAKMTKKDGFCAFGNNLYSKKMHREFSGNKLSVGACEDIYVENIDRSIGKTTCWLHIHNEKRQVSTVLCGKQALDNILLCVAVADKIGMTPQEIFDAIPKIQQVPHRLEYTFVNGLHILDDSYNANTVGVQYALEYLKIYPSPRIVVSQGVVEMGIMQKKENILIGRSLAKVADVVIVLGTNKKWIKRGLEEENFSGTIVTSRSLKQVKDCLKKYAICGATVLFQNDLPDIY